MARHYLSLLLFFTLLSSSAWAQILQSNPYLQNPTDGAITVCWQTKVPCLSYVEWGKDSNAMVRAHTLIAGQVLSNNTLNKIRVQGIEPGVQYFYRIVSQQITKYGAYKKEFGEKYVSPIYSFRLASKSDNDFDAIIFNDLHQKRATMDTLRKVIQGLKCDFIIFNGDCVDDPSTEAQAIGSISYFNDAVGATHIPMIYVRGNHEIRGAFSMGFTLLFDYVGGKTYGAMSWGDTRFVFLDCGEDKPDTHPVYYGLNDFSGLRAQQLEFLKQEHQSTEFRKAKKRILVHHIPLWGLGEPYNPCLDLWGAELSSQPYDIAINGHTHSKAFHPKGSIDNPFPVAIGGGYTLESATVMHLSKRGSKLRLDCYNTKAEVVFSFSN